MDVPPWLSGSVQILPGVNYPVYRLAIIGVGIAVALFLYLLYTLIFGLGTMLAGLAGVMAGSILAVESGMGESILILTFVVIVIGGIGSVRGALIGALLVGLVDTLTRSFLPDLLRFFLDSGAADRMGSSLASMSVYIFMALILACKPAGLFPVSSS